MNTRPGHMRSDRCLALTILTALFFAAQVLTAVPALASTTTTSCDCCCVCCSTKNADTPSADAHKTMDQPCNCNMDKPAPLAPIPAESLAPAGSHQYETNLLGIMPAAMSAVVSSSTASIPEGRSPPGANPVPLFILHASFLI